MNDRPPRQPERQARPLQAQLAPRGQVLERASNPVEERFLPYLQDARDKPGQAIVIQRWPNVPGHPDVDRLERLWTRQRRALVAWLGDTGDLDVVITRTKRDEPGWVVCYVRFDPPSTRRRPRPGVAASNGFGPITPELAERA